MAFSRLVDSPYMIVVVLVAPLGTPRGLGQYSFCIASILFENLSIFVVPRIFLNNVQSTGSTYGTSRN
jgi:hypothetical protein